MEQKILHAAFVIHNRHAFGIQSPMGANLQKRHLIVLLDNILIIVGVGLALMNIPILLHTALATAHLVTTHAVIPGLRYMLEPPLLLTHQHVRPNVQTLIQRTAPIRQHGAVILTATSALLQTDVAVKPPKAVVPTQEHTAPQTVNGTAQTTNVFLEVLVIILQTYHNLVNFYDNQSCFLRLSFVLFQYFLLML